jgi:hypothetical protein
MAAELPRPGVEVIQEIRQATPTIVRPTLVPFVCGPAKEVIEVTLADGTLNAESKQGVYSQLPKTISQTAFPSPRGNILEVDVEESTIKVFLLDGGALRELERDPGEAFLVAWNKSTKAAIRTKPITGAGLALDGKAMVIAIDVTARLNASKDVAIVFAGATVGANLTAEEVRDQINAAVGEDVASLIADGSDFRVQIASLAYGARSSVTIRAGGSANSLLAFTAAIEYRVEGSGFRGQDQSNNTTVTPWVEWTRGAYIETDATPTTVTSTTFPAITGSTAAFGLIDHDSVFANSAASALVFTGGGSIDLKTGDQFYADGALPSGASIKKVEASRFKLGTLNPILSVISNGKVISAVYDDANVNTLFSAAPFSPKYAWFRARNLKANAAATAAVATGATSGVSATQAIIESGAVTVPASLSGLTLIFGITVDGVELDDETFTFSAPPFASVAAIAAAITAAFSGVLVAADNGGNLTIATVKTGQLQALTLRSTSTALAALNFPTGSDISDVGTDVEFVDTAAVLTTVADIVFPLTLGGAGETLLIKKSTDGGTTYPTTVTHTFSTAGPFANIAALVAELTSGSSWGGAGPAAVGLAISNVGNKVVIKSVALGSLIGLQVDGTSTSIGSGASDIRYTASQLDVGEDEITGLQFRFQLNDRAKTYEAVLTSNSLLDAVDAINAAVGFPVATAGGDAEEQLVLTSTLKGAASKIRILVDTAGLQASRAFGFGSTETIALGTGRPDPDLQLDISGSAVLGAEILRSPITGTPFNPGDADTHIQYTGLRKDVSPSALSPGILNLSDVNTLQNVLNPINANNPLGLGVFFMMINAPNLNCTALGVDETSAAAPEGTLTAYTKVANFLESQEVYAIAPLTHDETAQMFKAHVELMSSPAQKGERILFFCPLVPDRAVSDVVAASLNGESTATDNEFMLDVNPAAGLNSRGINTAVEIPLSEDLYLELAITTGSGQEVRRYSVKTVNSTLLTFRTTFGTTENLDGFYTTTPLTETVLNADWTLAVRGDKLVIPGSSPALPDKQLIAETVAAKATAYKQRRLYYVFPDKVKSSIGGLEAVLPGYYMCAAYVGLVAAQPPQQGFTNFPVAGFTGVVGSNDYFSVRQLNVMAAGGTFIVVQDAQGAPLSCRHQLSTNMTSIETRELSITKVVDFVSKFKRVALRNFIGTFNITQPFLDQLSTVIHGTSQFLIENSVLIGADLNNLIQSKDAPDTVLIDETLDVPYPCNYIRLTLVL